MRRDGGRQPGYRGNVLSSSPNESADESFPLLPLPRSREELLGAGRALYLRAHRYFGDLDDLPQSPAEDLRILDAQLAVVTGLARDLLLGTTAMTPARIVCLSELLSDVQTLRFSVHEHLGSLKLRRLDALERGLEALWRIQHEDELLGLVSSTAVESCGFDRVMLSRVDDGMWRPWRTAARQLGGSERRLGEWVRGWPEIPLDQQVLESEVVRSQSPAIVRDVTTTPRVHVQLRQASSMTSYVVAPILAGDRVVGLLHADHPDSVVTELDLEILMAFSKGVGRIHERVTLLARLHDQHAQVLEGMRLIERNLQALHAAGTGLGRRVSLELLGERRDSTAPGARPTELGAGLTSRELEVLALMATGATNDRIAQRLVIATETVKTHVKRVLRKLGAENRAEAISMYLRFTAGAHDNPASRNVRALPR